MSDAIGESQPLVPSSAPEETTQGGVLKESIIDDYCAKVVTQPKKPRPLERPPGAPLSDQELQELSRELDKIIPTSSQLRKAALFSFFGVIITVGTAALGAIFGMGFGGAAGVIPAAFTKWGYGKILSTESARNEFIQRLSNDLAREHTIIKDPETIKKELADYKKRLEAKDVTRSRSMKQAEANLKALKEHIKNFEALAKKPSSSREQKKQLASLTATVNAARLSLDMVSLLHDRITYGRTWSASIEMGIEDEAEKRLKETESYIKNAWNMVHPTHKPPEQIRVPDAKAKAPASSIEEVQNQLDALKRSLDEKTQAEASLLATVVTARIAPPASPKDEQN